MKKKSAKIDHPLLQQLYALISLNDKSTVSVTKEAIINNILPSPQNPEIWSSKSWHFRTNKMIAFPGFWDPWINSISAPTSEQYKSAATGIVHKIGEVWPCGFQVVNGEKQINSFHYFVPSRAELCNTVRRDFNRPL